jgi:molybdopterin/thiamine biosynthesis adenylyltransferase
MPDEQEGVVEQVPDRGAECQREREGGGHLLLIRMQIMGDVDASQRGFLGGIFDRQVRIEGWRQDEIGRQTVLVLGVGALGCGMVINLLRLGVKKIFILDYDVVD